MAIFTNYLGNAPTMRDVMVGTELARDSLNTAIKQGKGVVDDLYDDIVGEELLGIKQKIAGRQGLADHSKQANLDILNNMSKHQDFDVVKGLLDTARSNANTADNNRLAAIIATTKDRGALAPLEAHIRTKGDMGFSTNSLVTALNKQDDRLIQRDAANLASELGLGVTGEVDKSLKAGSDRGAALNSYLQSIKTNLKEGQTVSPETLQALSQQFGMVFDSRVNDMTQRLSPEVTRFTDLSTQFKQEAQRQKEDLTALSKGDEIVDLTDPNQLEMYKQAIQTLGKDDAVQNLLSLTQSGINLPKNITRNQLDYMLANLGGKDWSSYFRSDGSYTDKARKLIQSDDAKMFKQQRAKEIEKAIRRTTEYDEHVNKLSKRFEGLKRGAFNTTDFGKLSEEMGKLTDSIKSPTEFMFANSKNPLGTLDGKNSKTGAPLSLVEEFFPPYVVKQAKQAALAGNPLTIEEIQGIIKGRNARAEELKQDPALNIMQYAPKY